MTHEQRLGDLEVISLFATDLATSRAFYTAVFGVPVVYEDDVSFVLRFDSILVNVIKSSEASELVAPQPARSPTRGITSLVTIRVENVDAAYERLVDLGVDLLNGPVDQPWGRRTVAFVDPSGHAWEIAQVTEDEEGSQSEPA